MSRTKIIIVEPEDVVAKDIEKTLLKYNYEVLDILPCKDLLHKALANNIPDLLVVGFGSNGSTQNDNGSILFFEELNIPAVFLTSYSESKIAELNEISNLFGYVFKPFNEYNLLSELQNVLQKCKTEEKIKHLNSVLKAIRKVNHNIITEKNPKSLIQKVCDNLIETREYCSIWITLFDDKDNYYASAFAGDFANYKIFEKVIKTNYKFTCIEKAKKQNGVQIIKDTTSFCTECPLRIDHKEHAVVSLPIKHDDNPYGVMTLKIQSKYVDNDEEYSLLLEVADDIAFTLHTIYEKDKLIETKDALNSSQNVFKSLIAQTNDAIYLLYNGKFELINKSFTDLYGYTFEDLQDNHFDFMSLYSTKSHAKIKQRQSRLRNNEKVESTYEFIGESKEGKEIECEASVNYINYKEGIGTLGVIRDISGRKKSEKLILENQANLKALIENTNDAIWSVDANYRILTFNTVFKELFKYGHNEEIKTGASLMEYVSDEIADVWRARYDKVLAGENLFLEDKTNLKDRIVYSEIFLYPIYSGSEISGVSVRAHDITDRKRSEELIHRSEMKYRTLVDNALVGVFRMTKSGDFIFANKPFLKMFGIETMIDVLEMNITDLISDADPMLDIILKEGGIQGYEHLGLSKSGRDINLLLNASLEGDVISGMIQDITEIKSAEKQIKENETKFRLLAENSIDVIWQMDLKFKFTYLSPSLYKLAGCRPEEWIGTYLWQHTTADEFLRMTRNAFKAIKKGYDYVVSFETKFLDRNNIEIPVEIDGKKLFDEDGNLIGLQGTTRDIRERKISEAALIQSEERFRNVYENATIGLFQSTIKGKITMANPAFANMLGFDLIDDILETEIVSLCAEKDSFDQFMEILNTEGAVYGYEFKLKKKDCTEIYIETSAKIVNDNQGLPNKIDCVVEDISNRRMFEMKLIEARDKAEKSDKLKSEFLAQMSHEIRTPINAILNFTDIIKSEVEHQLDGEVVSYFNLIHSASMRIIRTIDLILNMSDLQTGSYDMIPKEIDLYKDIIEKLYKEYRRIATDKSIDLLIESKTELSTLVIDEYSIYQSVSNLIDNAIKYTNSGKVEVTLYKNSKDKLAINISDTGTGISEDYLPKLFDAFSQEEQGYTRKYEGNGLGLAITKKFCELNNVEIDVKSKKGIGSEFTVIFN